MTYILCILGASCFVNLVLLLSVIKLVVRNSDAIDKLQPQSQEEEKETGLIAP